jgi:DNA invertase Pin-like site-specific DNA recombinase
MDAYIRVSQVGEREGESFRSPDIQLTEIKRWAKLHDVRVGKVVQDQDVSGGKAVAERGLEELIKRTEAGVSNGVLVHRVDRFSRDHLQTLLAVKRLKEAGARLVGVADGIDSDTEGSKIALNMMAMMAENYLDTVRANWRAAEVAAVASGIHVSGKVPVGYQRRDQVEPRHDARGKLIRDGRLVLDPTAAPVVRQAFEMRAREVSTQQIADHIADELGRGFTKSGARAMLRNRVYLGEARAAKTVVNPKAHKPIVTEELFAAAQRDAKYTPRVNTWASQSALSGLITCAACGNRLHVVDSGVGKASYVCRGRSSNGRCTERAVGQVRLVDEHVIGLLAEMEEDVLSGAASAEHAYLEAKEAVTKAEAELERFSDPTLSTDLGMTLWRRGIEKAAKNVEAARRALWDLDDPGLPEDAKIVELDGKKHIYTVWGDDPAADRRTLRRYVSSVTLTKADPARRRWQPIAERVTVAWRGGA